MNERSFSPRLYVGMYPTGVVPRPAECSHGSEVVVAMMRVYNGHMPLTIICSVASLHSGICIPHIQFIALGGTIGTGLFLDIGSTLTRAGPLSIFLGYSITGLLYGCSCRSLPRWLSRFLCLAPFLSSVRALLILR